MNPFEPERAAASQHAQSSQPSPPPPSDEPDEAASSPSPETSRREPAGVVPSWGARPEEPAPTEPESATWPWFGHTGQAPAARPPARPEPPPAADTQRKPPSAGLGTNGRPPAQAPPRGGPPQAPGGQASPAAAWGSPPRAPGGQPPAAAWSAPPQPAEAPTPSLWATAPARPQEQAPPSQWGVVAPRTQPGWQPQPPHPGPGWGAPPPRARRPGGRRGPLLVGGAIALVVALLLVGLVARPRGAPAPGRRSQQGRATTAAQLDPQAAASRLLAARARAIMAHDKGGFMAPVDRRRTAFYRSQSRLFDNLVTVPFQDFTYRLIDPRNDLASPTLRRRYGTARIYLPETEARYRFRGHDGSPVLSRFFYTFVRTPVGWRIAAQGEAKPVGIDDVEIWDGGPLRTAVTRRTLVVYHPGDRTLANRMLRAAETAYAQIDASWSGKWEHRVVILVPHDQNEAQRLVGATNLSKVAAVASSSIEAGPVERVLGNRVVVNTSNIANYDNLNLQVVTTHEMTHVATRTIGSGEPLYLVEGFADYAALRPIAQPLSVTRPALAKEVAQGRFDGRLPADDEFRASNDAAAAYDEASSFCLWVATTFGNAKLQALYRAFAGSQKPTIPQQDAHVRQVLGIPLRTAEARWAAWVQRQL